VLGEHPLAGLARMNGMIIGIGSDLCNIARIENSLQRFGERFTNRVFTDQERSRAERRTLTRAGTYAKRFAATSESRIFRRGRPPSP
jgi:holo-[acyl-carrier-protein] synthase